MQVQGDFLYGRHLSSQHPLLEILFPGYISYRQFWERGEFVLCKCRSSYYKGRVKICPQHHADSDLGVAVIDRYTHVVLNFLENINKTSSTTIQDLFNRYSFEDFRSNAGVRTDLYSRSPDAVKLTEFFGGVAEVDTTEPPVATVQPRQHTELAHSAKVRLNQAERKPVSANTDSDRGLISSKVEKSTMLKLPQFLEMEIGGILLVGHAICWLVWRRSSSRVFRLR